MSDIISDLLKRFTGPPSAAFIDQTLLVLAVEITHTFIEFQLGGPAGRNLGEFAQVEECFRN